MWIGSTNFTASGFLGQTNVGHRVQDAVTAQQYLDYWEVRKTDPELDDLRKEALKLTPDPAALIKEKSIVRVFSPRAKANLLEWYGDRMTDGASSVMFTAAFGVAKQLMPAIAKKRNLLRFILMEKPATEALQAQFKPDRFNIIMSYGVPLGQLLPIQERQAGRAQADCGIRARQVGFSRKSTSARRTTVSCFSSIPNSC